MALDPRIALEAKGADPNLYANVLANASNMQKLAYQPQQLEAELAASRANTANVTAQGPGIAADSAIKQRASAFNAWQAEHKGDWVKNGQVDHAAFVNAAALAGFYTEAQHVAANDLHNTTAAVNIRREQTASANDIQSYAKKGIGYAANLVSNLTLDPTEAVATGADPEAAASALELKRKAKWDELKAFMGQGVPGTEALMGEYSPAALDAALSGTMDIPTQTTTEINRLQAGITKHGNDPDSAQSQALAEQIIEARQIPTDSPAASQVRKGSYAENKQLYPDVAQKNIEAITTATVVPAAARQQKQEEGNRLLGSQKIIKNGADAAGKLFDKSSNIADMTWAQVLSRYGNDPATKQLSAGINAYNQEHPGQQLDNNLKLGGAGGLQEVLNTGAEILTPRIKSAFGSAGTGRLPKEGIMPGGSVKMMKGKFIEDVPIGEVDEAKQAGWKQMGGSQ